MAFLDADSVNTSQWNFGQSFYSQQPFFQPRNPPSTTSICFEAAQRAARWQRIFGFRENGQKMGKDWSEKAWPEQIWAKKKSTVCIIGSFFGRFFFDPGRIQLFGGRGQLGTAGVSRRPGLTRRPGLRLRKLDPSPLGGPSSSPGGGG